MDHWNCRCYLVMNIWPKLDRTDLEELSRDNYKNYKTEIFKILKEWDKKYLKHMKSTNPELSGITKECALPLTNLFTSNFNFYNLNQMIKKQ